MELFRLFGSVFLEDKDVHKQLDAIDKKGSSVGSKFGKVAGGIAKAGAVAGAAAIGFASVVGTKAVKAGADFETQMNNVSTLLDGDVSKRIGELGENVKKMSTETNVSTELLSDGLYQVISAFGDTEDASKILETAAKGAKAGNASVTDSVNLLSAVTKGYGDTSSEAAEKASDLAFLTVKLGQTTFPELASSMGKVIPLAGAMKVSQEELFGAMATLTGVTGGTAEVATQLRSTFQSFMKPSKELQATFEELGYATGAEMLESKGLAASLDMLKKSVGDDETAFANMFSSIEAGTAVLALTGTQADNFKEKTGAMTNAVGATEEAFKKQGKGFNEMLSTITNTLNVALISIGESLLPVLTSLFQELIKILPPLLEFINPLIQKLVPVLGTLITALLPVLMSLLDALIPVLDPLIDVFLMLVETVLIPFINLLVPIINQLMPVFIDLFNKLMPILQPILEIFMELVSSALPLFMDIFMALMPIMLPIIQLFSDLAKDLLPVFMSVTKTITRDVLPVFLKILQAIFKIIGPIIEGIGKVIGGVAKVAGGVVGKLSGFVSNIFGGKKEPGAALGGIVTSPGRVLVGEKGPELLNLPRAASIIPLPATGGVTFGKEAFAGAFFMDDYTTDKITDRITQRLKGTGVRPY